jgi:hypothetical protein
MRQELKNLKLAVNREMEIPPRQKKGKKVRVKQAGSTTDSSACWAGGCALHQVWWFE